MSDYQVHRWAVHELVKETEANDCALFLSERAMPLSDAAERLLKRLYRTFSQKNEVLQGRLSTPEDALFPGYFQHLLDEGLTDETFLQFSRDASQALQLSLQGVLGAKGGYLAFAHYTVHGREQVGIYLVRNAEGVVFQRAEHRFQLEPVTFLNVDKLAMAGQLPVAGGEEQHPVEVIKHARGQKDISDYFLAWLGLDQPASSRELTNTFLEAVAQLPPPIDEATGEQVDTSAFREQVLNFAAGNPTRTVNIKAFDENFYGEETPLRDFVQQNDIPLNETFRYDRQAMRDYDFHRFKANGLYFGCRHAFLLSGEVRVEGESVIIDHPELVEQLLDILREGVR